MDRVEGGEVIDSSRCSSFTWFLFCSAASAFLLGNAKDAVPLGLNGLPTLAPLKLLLENLGISVEHLVEGLRKCGNELGPEASESVKKLLVTTAAGWFVTGRAQLTGLPPYLSHTCECVFPPY